MTSTAHVLEFIETLALPAEVVLENDTPLMTSGIFDSLALLELAEWIETEVGSSIDPSNFDLRQEWNTLDSIAEFIERHRA